MKLTRKIGAPTLRSKEGLDIPSATIMPIKFNIDYTLKTVHVFYGLFSSEDSIDSQYQPFEKGELYFTEEYILPQKTSSDGVIYEYNAITDVYYYKDGMDEDNKPDSVGDALPRVGDEIILTANEISDLTETDSGRLPFDIVMNDLEISATEVCCSSQGSKDWLMTQKDWEGLPFSDNWEMVDD